MKPDIRRKGLLTTVDYGHRHKKVTYRRKQPSVHVREGDRIIKTIHFQPLRKRLAYKLRRAYRKTLYYLKFSFLVGAAAAVAAIFMDAAIQTYAVASYGEPSVVKDYKTFLVEQLGGNVKLPAALEAAARCETGRRHRDSKGKVIVNQTGDVGYLQINEPINGAEAKKLGYNIYDENDNKRFGIVLFEREGLQPWAASTNLKTLRCVWEK